MAARTTLAGLITRLRRLVNDPGAAQTWDDDELQDWLDANRLDVRRAVLRPETTWVSGTVTYTDYYADYGDWESDVVLQDAEGNELTPVTSELVTGRWTFTEQRPPVYITGKTYDLYGAAAEVLEAWAARSALLFDFEADGASYKRSQAGQALERLAERYRGQARPRRVVMRRDDVA